MADFGYAFFIFGRDLEWERMASVTVRERLKAVWRAGSGTGSAERTEVEAGVDLTKRRTLALPSILTPYRGEGGGRDAGIPKPTQANLRKFAETPLVRRAINVIKDSVVGMDWQVRVRRGVVGSQVANARERLSALRRTLEEPNSTDSFRTLIGQVIEDALTGGYGAIEMEATGDPAQMWPVDGATIRVNAAS